MKARVLVVDDSGFFLRRLCEIFDSDPLIEVVGTARNGEQALEKIKDLKPDVVTMDIEMPVMDGITATRHIMASQPMPILMFSSLTTEGAQATLDALDAGAMDFLPKRFDDISHDREEAKRLLCQRVLTLAQGKAKLQGRGKKKTSTSSSVTPPSIKDVKPSSDGPVKLVAIGTSTGGPAALQQVLSSLPANFPVPLLLIQHMPASFTPAFAKRLDQLCHIVVRQAEDGDRLEPATAYLAPGGMQMTLEGNAGRPVLRIHEAKLDQTYKPSVDMTFSSIANVYPRETLAVVLTGMGADGREGARLLNEMGSIIWAQDEDSCTVYGMPAAVTEAGIVEKIITLSEVGISIAQRV